MVNNQLKCPHCGEPVQTFRNPFPTVDIVIEIDGGIVLIERKNPPYGWALPGGFVDYGETLEHAAEREAQEETGLKVTQLSLLGCYSDPLRDERQHNISTVFVAKAEGTLTAGDDAANAKIFPLDQIPKDLCFDHPHIISDYRAWKNRR